jgi:hypothetical protein
LIGDGSKMNGIMWSHGDHEWHDMRSMPEEKRV